MAPIVDKAAQYLQYAAMNIKVLTGYEAPTLLAGLVTLATLAILITRATSGSSSATRPGTSTSPPSLPYWIPFFRHLPQWLFAHDMILEETRKAFPTGISTLRAGSDRHHIVSSARILHELETSKKGHLSDILAKQRVWRNAYGVPKQHLSLYQELVSALQIPTTFHLGAELDPKRLGTSHTLMRRLQGNIPDLVTFNPNVIDQEPWEKLAITSGSEDNREVEVSLLPLVFLFLTHQITASFVSENLLTDQDHEATGPLLLAFVQSFSLLHSGLPRWLPHSTLPGAHITRYQLLKHLDGVLDITEDVEVQNDLMAARSRMMDDHKAPRNIRTIELLRLLHGLNAPNVLSFWMLVHIIHDPALLERVREEARRAVKIVHEGAIMGFTVPPRVTIDTAALLGRQTPLLKQCWLESVRLYSRGQASWTATEDFEVQGDEGGVFKSADRWSIRKGDWIDAPLWHGNTDEARWEEPLKWDHERHQCEEGENLFEQSKVAQDPELFGMHEATGPARLFALAFVASTVLLYDVEVDPEKDIPRAKFAAGVALPDTDLRVRFRKRSSA